MVAPLSVPEIAQARAGDKVFMAALALYLGVYVPPLLDADKRHRIRGRVDEMLTQFNPGSWKTMPWSSKASFLAAAMARLEIDPMPGLKWTAFYDPRAAIPDTSFRWGIWPLAPDPLPGLLIRHFHPYHASTEDARKVLRGAGYDVPDRDPVIP